MGMNDRVNEKMVVWEATNKEKEKYRIVAVLTDRNYDKWAYYLEKYEGQDSMGTDQWRSWDAGFIGDFLRDSLGAKFKDAIKPQ